MCHQPKCKSLNDKWHRAPKPWISNKLDLSKLKSSSQDTVKKMKNKTIGLGKVLVKQQSQWRTHGHKNQMNRAWGWSWAARALAWQSPASVPFSTACTRYAGPCLQTQDNDMEAGSSEIQAYPQVDEEIEANLGYLRPSLNKNNRP